MWPKLVSILRVYTTLYLLQTPAMNWNPFTIEEGRCVDLWSFERWMEWAVIVHNLDGEAGSHTGVDHRRGMSHDAAALQVAEAVHKRTHGPLNCCGHRERDEAQSWP